jgi:hypothetical protein
LYSEPGFLFLALAVVFGLLDSVHHALHVLDQQAHELKELLPYRSPAQHTRAHLILEEQLVKDVQELERTHVLLRDRDQLQ